MLEIMVEEKEGKKEKLSIEEIENLNYYDFMAYLNAFSFSKQRITIIRKGQDDHHLETGDPIPRPR